MTLNKEEFLYLLLHNQERLQISFYEATYYMQPDNSCTHFQGNTVALTLILEPF